MVKSTKPNDLMSFLGKTKWKTEGDLLIPSHMVKVTALDVSAAVYITYKEVYGKKYTLSLLKSQLKQISIEDCLISISRILTVLQNEGYSSQKTQKGLAEVLLSKEVAKFVSQKLGLDPKYKIFFEQQLLVLFKYTVLYCKKESANDYNNRKDFNVFSDVLLGVTDLLVQGAEDWGERELQEEAIRNSYFYSKENFLQTISRYYELFIEIPESLKVHPLYTTIGKLFKRSTGLKLEDYIISGYGLIGLLVQQRAGNFKKDYWLVNIKRHFSTSQLNKKEIQLIFDEYTTKTAELEKNFKAQGDKEFSFNFSGLVHHPLVSYDGRRYYPISLRFLKEKITKQIYWVIFDYLKRNASEKELYAYRNFMGVVFEEYVFRTLERMYPESTFLPKRLFREIDYKKKGNSFKTVDNIIVYPSSLLLVEVKISQIQIYRTGIIGDLEAFEEDVDKVIVEAFKQLKRSKNDFRDNTYAGKLELDPKEITNFQPLIVTLNEFPNFPLLWKIIRDKIKKTEFYDDELVNKLQIIDIEELEILEEFTKHSGMSLEEVLKKKTQDRLYTELPMKNYLYYEYPDYRGLLNQHLDRKYKVFTQKVRERLFNAKNKAATSS